MSDNNFWEVGDHMQNDLESIKAVVVDLKNSELSVYGRGGIKQWECKNQVS